MHSSTLLGSEPESPAQFASDTSTDDVFVMPASVAQERYWLLDQLEPGNTSLNMPLALKVTGAVDVDVLRRTLDEIVSRHEVLRTTFIRKNGELLQVIASQQPAQFDVIDLSSAANPGTEADRLIVDEAHAVFDLAKGPLFRSKLITIAPGEHTLLLTLHHSVCDGWSNGVLVREIGEIYEAFAKGDRSPLDELPIQYGDFAMWQREWFSSAKFDEQLEFWKDHLGTELPVLEIPTDFPRSKNRTSFGSIESLLLPRALTRAIKALAQRDDTTPYMIFLAALNILLHKHCEQEQILIGSPTANRLPIETEPLIGPFANTLLIKSDLSGDPSISEFLQRTKDVALGAFGNQTLPFEKLVEKIKPARGQNRTQLFQVLFIFQTAFMKPVELDGLKITPIRSVSPGSVFDLSLGVVERVEGTRLQLEYNTDLFRSETIKKFLDDLHAILRFAVLDTNRKISDLVFEQRNPETAPDLDINIGTSEFSLGAPAANGNGAHAIAVDLESNGNTLRPNLADVQTNGNGKLAAVPETIQPASQAPNEITIEQTLIQIWMEMLHVKTVGPDDDFFELGGHSLLGAQIFNEIEKRLGVNLPLAALLSATTVRQLGALVRESMHSSLRAEPTPHSIEDTLTQIWKEMLHLDSVGLDDDFFEVGGHSLLGAQIFNEIEKRLGVNLPLAALLNATTVRQLAILVRESMPSPLKSESTPHSIEDTLVQIWKEMLHLDSVSLDDDFFEVGGHSLLGAQIFNEIGKRLGVNLPLAELLNATTIRQLATLVRGSRPKDDLWTSLVPLNPNGTKPPIFLMHAAGGNVLFYRDLAERLGSDQPTYGMQAVGLGGHQSAYDRIEDMASHYIKEIRAVQPNGPYFVGGASVGGLTAFEVAKQLKASGEEVALVALFDTGAPGYPIVLRSYSKFQRKIFSFTDRLHQHAEAIWISERGRRFRYVAAKATKVKNQIRRSYRQTQKKIKRGVLTSFGRSLPDALIVTQNAIAVASKSYFPTPYEGDVLLFRATKQQRGIQKDETLGWAKYVSGKLDIYEVRGNHGTIVTEPRVRFVTDKLQTAMSGSVNAGEKSLTA